MSKNKKVKVKALNNREIAGFCNQLAMLLSSGISPLDAATVLLADSKDPQTQLILSDLQRHLQTGEKFHIALSMTEVFPQYVISMIKIGEETGTLDEVLVSLTEFYEREESLTEGFRSAILYPMIMIIMVFLIIIVMITRVMPVFSQVFAQLGTSMNSFSQGLLSLGTALSGWSFVLVVLLIALTGFLIFAVQNRRGHELMERISSHIRPLKELYNEMAIGRFANGMALAISSGMDIYTSLDLLKSIVENKDIAVKIERCKEELTNGESFPDALRSSDILSNVYSRMVMVGFRSGSMDKVLTQIADRYEQRVNRRISRTLSIIEPTLVIVLSVIVGLILLSVILPLMGIMGTIG